MNLSRKRRRTVTAALATIALVTASCGGGSGNEASTATPAASSGTDSPTDTSADTTVAVTNPPATDPPATDPPPTNPPATDPPPTDPPVTAPPIVSIPGQACVGSREGVSCLQDNGEWATYDESNGLSSNFVTSIDACLTGELIVGTTSGLDLYDGDRWFEFLEPFEFGSLSALQCASIDDIWAGGFDEAAHWDGSSWELFETDAVGFGIINDLELDANGNPWFGSSEGIHTYDGATWTVYDESNAFRNHSVKDLSFAPNGRLEAALLLTRATFDGTSWVESDDNGTPTAIAANDSSILIGRFNKGVDLVLGATTATLDRSTGEMPTDKIKSMTADGQGRVWVGTEYGLVVLQDGVVLHTFQMDDSGIHDNAVELLSVQGDGPSTLGEVIPGPLGSLSGVITDGAAPVAGATVEICVLKFRDSFDGATPCVEQPLVYNATTEANGVFTIPDVVRGRYVFVVNPGAGWIQATGDFGISSERILVEGDLDIGEFAAVAAED